METPEIEKTESAKPSKKEAKVKKEQATEEVASASFLKYENESPVELPKIEAYSKTTEESPPKVKENKIQREGNPDLWKVITRIHDEATNNGSTTFGMQVADVGTLIRVFTYYQGSISESLQMIGGVRIIKDKEGNSVLARI